jgi:hypothetical protein
LNKFQNTFKLQNSILDLCRRAAMMPTRRQHGSHHHHHHHCACGGIVCATANLSASLQKSQKLVHCSCHSQRKRYGKILAKNLGGEQGEKFDKKLSA